MVLWTIQAYEAYEKLLQDKVLTADSACIFYDDIQRDAFQVGYDWMVRQMKKRGLVQPENVDYPIWAWYKWEGKRKRHDMRSYSNPNKDKIVQLTIKIDDSEVLLTDFDTFHYALNYWYLPLDENESESFEKEYTNFGISRNDLRDISKQSREINNFRERIEKSWDRILDLEREDNNYVFGYNSEKSIQATFWELRADQVIKAELYPIKQR